MNNKILFSPVGDSDPVRGGYDGGMLHIVRHFRPNKVYLYFTKKMSERENENNNVCERFIKNLNSNCEVVCVHTEIENAHHFDNFTNDFERIINRIFTDNPDCELLINPSSGTPQMKINLCLIAVTSKYRMMLVQVASPQKGSNRDLSHESDYSDESAEYNLDSLSESKNRCIVDPNIIGFKKAKLKSQISILIKSYDYRASIEVLKGNEDLFKADVLELLEHAQIRTSKNYEIARMSLKSKHEFLLNKLPPKLGPIYEYLLVMDIKRKQGEINDFVLRISPFLQELSKLYIEEANYNLLCSITEYSRFSIKKCSSSYPDLITHLNNEYAKSGGVREVEISVHIMLSILVYVISNKNLEENAKRKIIDGIDWFKTKVLKIRNDSAHSLIIMSEDDLKNSTGKDSYAIMNELFKFINYLFADKIKKANKDLYNMLNQKIIEYMEETVID